MPGNEGFVEYADALDRVERHLGGSGIDRDAYDHTTSSN
jgi:hypothetical protein